MSRGRRDGEAPERTRAPLRRAARPDSGPEGGRRGLGISSGWLLTAAFLVVLPAGALLGARSQQDEPFPHEEHAGLFPVCTGCHEGIPVGETATVYPESATCAECHDGGELERVEWTPPPPRASNLDFTHVHHAEELAEEGEEALQCESCHSADPDVERMSVERGRPSTCLSCHAPETEDHYAGGGTGDECSVCHVPLAESGFDLARLENLPEPEAHDDTAFLGRLHGETAVDDVGRCATCHVQDSCASCHVDAGRSEIAAVPAAPAGMTLPPYEAEYPVPESHRTAEWIEDHDGTASAESCATCHTRDDCAACHQAPAPTAVTALPRRADVRAPGVVLGRRAPESHSDPDFVRRHETLGDLRSSTCGACHTQTFCSSCHDGGPVAAAPPGAGGAFSLAGPASSRRSASSVSLRSSGADGLPLGPVSLASSVRSSYRHLVRPSAGATAQARRSDTVPAPERASSDPEFHPPNYALRHAADAWGRTLECASCHSTEVFCRSCHVESGVGSRGRPGPGYHDAVPLWLFRHGTAARQGLESCASCHTETQCLRCHSSLGAFRVSPHGPDFDPERAQSRNARTCFVCHLTDPLQGPEP